jgi:hypothetical protein
LFLHIARQGKEASAEAYPAGDADTHIRAADGTM